MDKDISRCANNKKPIEVRMGKGKGNVEYWVSKVQPGKVLYEMEEFLRRLPERHLGLQLQNCPFSQRL